MVKDDKINLKLEVLKDKNSGQLLLMAHFNQNAPNVFKENENMLWMPTVEEKDFINEAFKLIPEGSTSSPPKEKDLKPEDSKGFISETEESKESSIKPEDSKGFISETEDTEGTISKPEELKEIISEMEDSKEIISEPGKPRVIISNPEKSKENDTLESQSPTKEFKPEDTSPVKKSEDSSINSESTEDIKTDDTNKKIESDDIPPDIDESIIEELKAKELKTLEEEKDKAIIVEADADAIDAALKKRTNKDESIVEADEQTIIDKVLSQKKKGKWSNNK